MALKKNVPQKRRPAPTPRPSATVAEPPKKAAPKKAPPKKVAPTQQVSEPPKQSTPPPTPQPKPQPPQASTPPKPQPTPMNLPTQLSYNQLKELPHAERMVLWELLNKVKSDDFIQLIRRDQLPKQLVLRKLEANVRGILAASKPPGKHIYYCPYCTDYMQFKYHAYTGYHKCIGCSISTRDFYVSADNQLFNAI